MEAQAQRARAAVVSLGRRGRTARVPDEVRREVVRYVELARGRGETWASISATVGLSKSALLRWSPSRRRPGRAVSRLRRVAIVGEPLRSGMALCLTTPGGYRVEGLTAESALALLRGLA